MFGKLWWGPGVVLVLALNILPGAQPAVAQDDDRCAPVTDYGLAPCTPLDAGDTFDALSTPGTQNYYAVVTPGSQKIHVELRDLPANYDLYLMDQDLNTVAASAQPGTQPEVIDASLDKPGVYVIVVAVDASQQPVPDAQYHLHLDWVNAASAQTSPQPQPPSQTQAPSPVQAQPQAPAQNIVPPPPASAHSPFPITVLSPPTTVLNTSAGGGALSPNQPRCFAIRGVDTGIWPDAAAVMVNVTAGNVSGDGSLTLYPAGGQPSDAPAVYYSRNFGGATDSTFVKIGAAGQICAVARGAATNAVVQVLTVFSGDAPKPIEVFDSPRVLLDTRGGTPVQSHNQRCFNVAAAGVPAQATAVLLNVTGIPLTLGNLQASVDLTPAGGSIADHPPVVRLSGKQSIFAGPTLIDPRPSGGALCVETDLASTVNVAVHALGYLVDGSSSVAWHVLPKAFEVMNSAAASSSGFDAGYTQCTSVAGVNGVPGNASEVLVSVGARDNVGRGYLTIFSDWFPATAAPVADVYQDGNWGGVVNTMVVSIGSDGKVCLGVGLSGAAFSMSVIGYGT